MKSQIPKLRFPEFSDKWELMKLGDIAKNGFSNGVFNDPRKVGSGYKIINVKDMFVGNEINIETLTLVNIEEKEFLKNKVKYGDIFFTRSSLVKEGIAISNVNLSYSDELTYDGHLIKMSPKLDLFNPKFLALALKFEKTRFQFVVKGKTTTMTTIGQEEVSSVFLSLPQLPEQTKIANFLTAVDEKIQALKEKKRLLEEYKKGLMQQIFSQEIRFKQNDGSDFPDWEEKSLGEISNIKRGASPRPISDKKWFSNNSNIGWVRISDVTKSNKFLNKTEQYLSDEGVKKSRFLEKGNLIMSICATIGKPIYTNIPVCIHDGFVVFDDIQADREYVYYYLDFIQDKWYQYGQPGSQVNLNTEIVSNEIINFPSISEQQKIAKFLTSVDEKIEKVGQQIKEAQSFNKGLLQQMFV